MKAQDTWRVEPWEWGNEGAKHSLYNSKKFYLSCLWNTNIIAPIFYYVGFCEYPVDESSLKGIKCIVLLFWFIIHISLFFFYCCPGTRKIAHCFLFYNISLKTLHKNFNEVSYRYFSFQLNKLTLMVLFPKHLIILGPIFWISSKVFHSSISII